MATAVTTQQLHHFPPGRRHAQRQGILLSNHQNPLPIPTITNINNINNNPRPLSLTVGGSRSPARRIRFAPLPDPRRSVLITDDGNELPLPEASSATQFPAPPTPSPAVDNRQDYFAVFDSASFTSSCSDSKRNSDYLEPSSSSSASSSPGTATPVSITTTTPSEYDNSGSVPPSPISCPPSPLVAVSNKLSAVSASSKARPFSFLRSLKRNSVSSSSSSSNTLTPTPSIDRTNTPTATTFSRKNFSAEEILTLGTIHLFRPSSSRDASDNEGASSSGWSLARWSSAGSHHTHHAKEPNFGSPLARVSSTQSTQSTQSYQSKAKAKSGLSKGWRPSSSNGLRPSRTGTRMLNGRVYGVKRPQNTNLFASARDDEPEFVEWGYGGMGSVKGARSAGVNNRWGRLHGQSTTSQPAGSRDDDDEDDGSGMMWVKRRREQREREQKEKEEKERLEKEEKEKLEKGEVDKPLDKPPVKKDVPSRPGTASSAKTYMSAASSCTITPSNLKVSTPLAIITTAASPPPLPVPAPSSAAPAVTPTVPSADDEHVTRAVNIPAPHRYHHHRVHSRGGSKDLLTGVEEVDVEKGKESESESRSNSESESESDVEHEEEEEDEEDEEEESRRRTALGAGVEKISRHH